MTEARWHRPPPVESLVPENAPFDEEQRAWLNGFLAGLLGLAETEPRSAVEARPVEPETSPPLQAAAWRDPALPAEERVQLSEGESHERRLMSALAQLECGQCGFSCQGYAHALATLAEKDPNLCLPGGRATARHLESLLNEHARGARAWALGGVARRSVRGPETVSPAPAISSRRQGLAVVPELARQAHGARIKSQKKLTFTEAGSDIREVVLELTGSEIQYRAGDSLAVFPHNDPDLVRALLRAAGARGQELITTPSGSCEVWRCLLEDVDITHVRDETLELFAHEFGDGKDVRSLRDQLQQSPPSQFDLLDLLAMFPSARPGIERIVATLGLLEPRVYAIASSPNCNPGEVHLLVRMLRSERAGRERKGVASHYLAEAVFQGDEVAARVQPTDRFLMPEDRSGPMIMLGSGTGLARYRAFLQELEAQGRRGNTWLIMASCFDGDEALYETELKAWSRLGVLEHLDVIRFGQRGRRIGPEDVLRKRARRVLSWLDRGAVLYACGEGKALSGVLDDTLIEVLGRQGKMSHSEASDFIHVMRRDGRYVEEMY
jgi:sulfite reductase (NADPH) flavoprotein alpha-component